MYYEAFIVHTHTKNEPLSSPKKKKNCLEGWYYTATQVGASNSDTDFSSCSTRAPAPAAAVVVVMVVAGSRAATQVGGCAPKQKQEQVQPYD